MPYIDEKEIYTAIEAWRGDNAMYGIDYSSEELLLHRINKLPRVDDSHVMTCKTCRANKVCDHRRYCIEECGNYIPLDI